MTKIEKLAEAMLSGDGLLVRSLAQDFFCDNPRLADVPRPSTDDAKILAAAASLLELFAMRGKQPPPAWTKTVGALSEPMFLVNAATKMKHLRALCQAESPEPLRKRGFYATPNYLEFA